jgi:hypothetical protein
MFYEKIFYAKQKDPELQSFHFTRAIFTWFFLKLIKIWSEPSHPLLNSYVLSNTSLLVIFR